MNRKIVSCYHHSFAGGSKNASRFLHYLAQDGFDVDGYFFETPQFFSYTKSNVRVHSFQADAIRSEVIDTNVLRQYSIVNEMIDSIQKDDGTILFGANLFPYCNMLHEVKSQAVSAGLGKPKLIVHPVGSDIWQIGPQVKSRVKWLLDSPLVDHVVTYSSRFVEEIQKHFRITRDIHILPPVCEKESFFQLDDGDKKLRKSQIGLSEDDFIIHHHSSMRKIKCPEVILEIAKRSSSMINSRTVLIMVGPIPLDLLRSKGIGMQDISSSHSVFKFKSDFGKLLVYWTGISSMVEYLLQIADVELNASLHDSFNTSLMEAMACGVPVVTSDVVGIADHISLSKAGFCYRTATLSFDELNAALSSSNSTDRFFDLDAAVDAIVTLHADRAASTKMGDAGARYVRSNFTFENAFAHFSRLLT